MQTIRKDNYFLSIIFLIQGFDISYEFCLNLDKDPDLTCSLGMLPPSNQLKVLAVGCCPLALLLIVQRWALID